MSSTLQMDKQLIKDVLVNLKLKEQTRGEELSVEQFISLSNLISEYF
jgi:16S rRNA A1518/A1519 N6-dimethyltransferase RsmA/KsgA/DIM1 with predicted DNA glycosylase/AP lyase activity